MIPWEKIGSAQVPDGGGTLELYRRGDEYSMRVDRSELMNSRQHDSEEALARLGCERLKDPRAARVLIGGLGMGFTLRAALDRLGPGAAVTVAELVPEVVEWNRGPLGHLADHPLEDPRAEVFEGDVARLLARRRPSWDLILLDVDNGPEGLTHERNERLYTNAGLADAAASLGAGGVLAVWSAHPSPAFTRGLARAGFEVEERRVRARGDRGPRHWIWLARRA